MPNQTISTTLSGKKYLTTDNPFERKFGYHRAVRKGPFIFVSGTTALKSQEDLQNNLRSSLTKQMLQDMATEGTEETEKSQVHSPGSSYNQAIIAMRRCIDAVETLGGTAGDVVRVKMFVGGPDYCGDVGDALLKCFGPANDHAETSEIGATATMIVVQNGFVDKDIRVEVEVDAVVL